MRPKRPWPWYRPVLRNWRRYYLRQFPRKKKLHGGWLHGLLGNRLFDPGLWVPTRDTVALDVTIGVLIGLMPLVGLQIILSVILCFIFRVNVTSAVVATFISNPLTGPGILYIQYLVGKEFSTPIDPTKLEQLTGVFKLWAVNGRPLIIGVLITSIMGAILAYPITLLLWSMVTKATAKALAVRNAKRDAHEKAQHSI